MTRQSGRRSTLEQLGEAIRAADKPKIADVAALLAGYPLPGNWGEMVRQAKAEVEATRRLLDVLRSDRRASLAEVFDVRLIRQNAEAFAPYEARLREWLPTEILPAAKLGLGMPVGRKALVKAPDSRCGVPDLLELACLAVQRTLHVGSLPRRAGDRQRPADHGRSAPPSGRPQAVRGGQRHGSAQCRPGLAALLRGGLGVGGPWISRVCQRAVGAGATWSFRNDDRRN